MKRGVASTCVILLLSACKPIESNPADSYQRWTDQMIVRLGLPNIGIWPCPDEKETFGGLTAYIAQPTDKCFKMQPQQRWQGTWVLGPGEHEEQFCPSFRKVCRWETLPRFELEWNPQTFRSRPQVRAEWGKIYAVDFVGRRATYPTDDEFIGQEYVIVVDRLNSITEIGPSKG